MIAISGRVLWWHNQGSIGIFISVPGLDSKKIFESGAQNPIPLTKMQQKHIVSNADFVYFLTFNIVFIAYDDGELIWT